MRTRRLTRITLVAAGCVVAVWLLALGETTVGWFGGSGWWDCGTRCTLEQDAVRYIVVFAPLLAGLIVAVALAASVVIGARR
jgi:hypothetical protein